MKTKMKTICFFTWIYILFFSNMIFCGDSSSQQLFMITEHPRVTYYNTKHILYANLTSKRFGRRDNLYYVDFNIHFLNPIGNNVTVHFYIYQLLTNVYKRSFVEMHLGFCDLINEDAFFGAPMRQGRVMYQKCPFAAGPYHFYNMSVPVQSIPRSFPFSKGRVYANISVTATAEVIGSGYIDMELKSLRNRNKKET